MEEFAPSNPPRNGEVDHAQHGGGVDSAEAGPSVSPDGLPPPRSGEDRRRVKHRTVGASDENVRFARQLRRKMTLPEVLLWQQLRRRPGGNRFRRQFPYMGFVLDFACLEQRVAVEVDGEAHLMGRNPERYLKRDQLLQTAGFRVLRIAARDVLKDLDAVLRFIILTCDETRPLHHDAARRGPPPRSGEELR